MDTKGNRKKYERLFNLELSCKSLDGKKVPGTT
jgi:hypothetical protein